MSFPGGDQGQPGHGGRLEEGNGELPLSVLGGAMDIWSLDQDTLDLSSSWEYQKY